MARKILLILILASTKRCGTKNFVNEDGRLFKRSVSSPTTVDKSNDYGFYLGDFTEETIMNGQETMPHQYPWMVFVCGKSYIDSEGALVCNECCGGSFIHRQYILTASHCVAGGTIDDTFVVTRAHNVRKEMLNWLNWSDLIDIILHPEYDATKQKEFKRSPDIAILKLSESVVFSPQLNAISLPDFSQVDKNYENEYAVVAGWGVRGYDKKNTPITSDDKLLEATVKIRSNSWCKGRAKLQFIKRCIQFILLVSGRSTSRSQHVTC